MSWQQRLGPLVVVVAVAGACSGGGEQPAPDQAAGETTTTIEVTTTTAAPADTATVAPPTTSSPSDEAPRTLAFSSSSDLGRLFEISGFVAPATSAGAETVGDPLSDGTLVQATSLRSSDGVVWVRINSTTDIGGGILGWVPSDDLRPTTQSVERFDADAATQFRQVSRVVIDDELSISATAGGGSTVGTLAETEIAMHGGTSVLTADGEVWLDVIDSTTQQRRGWVAGSSFGVLTSIEAKSPDGTDVDRRADSTLSYGGGLSTGTVSATGCNAQQLTFDATSSNLGTTVLFGTAPPVGSPLDSANTRFRWSSSGGSTVYLTPGQSVTFSFPSQSTKTWYFTTLDDDRQARFATSGGSALLDASGRATATDVQSFQVDAGACAQVDPVEPEIDPYVYDLPADERDAAIAEFEQELAEFRAANGIAPPPGSAGVGTSADDTQSAEGETVDGETAVDGEVEESDASSIDDTAPVADGPGENSDPNAITTTGGNS